MTLLSSSQHNLNDCLSNCSNHGRCSKNILDDSSSKTLINCECDMLFSGGSCHVDTRFCSTNSCLNNATCIDHSTSNNKTKNQLQFECACQVGFHGVYCELQDDLCSQFDPCNGHGQCSSHGNRTECECFIDFDGDRCENEDFQMKIMRKLFTISSLVLLLSAISLFVFLIVGNDVLNVIGGDKWRQIKKRRRKRKLTLRDVIKYYNLK